MRTLPWILLVAAVACFAFAYWGLETPAGRRAYDEMAGMIPMAAALAGAVFGLAAVAIWIVRWWRA